MDYIDQEKESIIEKLLKNGKVRLGQLIDYQYFKELYEPHRETMSEEEFARMLGITSYNYTAIKNNKLRTTKVLKDRIEKVSEGEKQEIVQELLKSGKLKLGQQLDYKYFQQLYEEYKENMSEEEFARILGITSTNYRNMKNESRRTKVLKDKREEIKEEEKIVEDLLNSGKLKPGQTIDYKYFQQLYEEYKENMSEEEFARILGITSYNYSNIKNESRRTKVLEARKEILSEREKQKIVEDLLNSGKLKPGQPIDYKYFQQLYEPYKQNMSEEEFAKILQITYLSYKSIKNNGQRAKVLKGKTLKESEKEKNKIIEELLNNRKLKPGQSVDYKYFQQLYEPYKQNMSEEEFATLLGINYGNYLSIKNRGQRGKILKDRIEKTSEKEEKEIIQELLNSEKVKKGQFIDYEYFKELYHPYKDKMEERDFASLLGIKYSNYRNLKNKGTRAKILKDRIEKVSEEAKQEIVEDLLNSGKVKVGQLITYEYFKKLYKLYKEKMAEIEFAELLGINYDNYKNIKYLGTKAKVLKDRIEKVSEEEKQEIIEELVNSEKVKTGQLINYEYFKELYEPYQEKMTEAEFAYLLGINYGNYNSLKKSGTKAKVMHYKDKEKIERIKYIVNQDSRYYSQEELVDLSEKYNCSIDTIIQYLLCSGMDNEFLDVYKEVLEERR